MEERICRVGDVHSTTSRLEDPVVVVVVVVVERKDRVVGKVVMNEERKGNEKRETMTVSKLGGTKKIMEYLLVVRSMYILFHF